MYDSVALSAPTLPSADSMCDSVELSAPVLLCADCMYDSVALSAPVLLCAMYDSVALSAPIIILSAQFLSHYRYVMFKWMSMSMFPLSIAF